MNHGSLDSDQKPWLGLMERLPGRFSQEGPRLARFRCWGDSGRPRMQCAGQPVTRSRHSNDRAVASVRTAFSERVANVASRDYRSFQGNTSARKVSGARLDDYSVHQNTVQVRRGHTCFGQSPHSDRYGTAVSPRVTVYMPTSWPASRRSSRSRPRGSGV